MSAVSATVEATSGARSGPANAELPTVTVVVPTYNRAVSLADTLDRLLGQDYPTDRLDLVIVDNSSTDDTEAVVQTAQRRSPFPLRYFRKENRGPAAARNFGIAQSGGEIVGFTDSDCHVPPTWVREAVGRFQAGVGLVSGPIRPIWPEHHRLGFFQHQIGEVVRESPLYPTANAFFRRKALTHVGGFEEQFGAFAWGPPAGGEDTDLAWRVKAAGYRSAFAESVYVEHEASAVGVKTWLLTPLTAQVFPRLVAHNPELRERYLFWRIFLGWGNILFYIGVFGGILGCRRSPRWLLLALPWIWVQRGPIMGDRWPPSRWWRIPVKYVFLAERSALVVAALAFSSARWRALVL